MGIKTPVDISTRDMAVLRGLLDRYLPGIPVWAFGSRVKWTSRPDSDLDLVVFSSASQSRQVHDLKDALEESNLPFRVDILVWDDISENFRENIRKQYVELVGSKSVELGGGAIRQDRNDSGAVDVGLREDANPTYAAVSGGKSEKRGYPCRG